MKDLNIGIQLHSLREEMKKDLPATLKKVSQIGYKYVEFAGFFGYSAQKLKKMSEDLGLKCISVHQGLDEFLQNPLMHTKFLNILGVKYVAIPYISNQSLAGGKDYKNTIEDITKAGKYLADGGMQLLYHNHDGEFKYVDGKYILDLLYQDIPADILKAQFDTCWIRYANVDVCRYIGGYGGRCPVLHLKDFTADSAQQWGVSGRARVIKDKEADNFKYKPLGHGVMDIPQVIKTALKGGTKYFIVEQDSSFDIPPLQAAEESFKYLKNLQGEK